MTLACTSARSSRRSGRLTAASTLTRSRSNRPGVCHCVTVPARCARSNARFCRFHRPAGETGSGTALSGREGAAQIAGGGGSETMRLSLTVWLPSWVVTRAAVVRRRAFSCTAVSTRTMTPPSARNPAQGSGRRSPRPTRVPRGPGSARSPTATAPWKALGPNGDPSTMPGSGCAPVRPECRPIAIEVDQISLRFMDTSLLHAREKVCLAQRLKNRLLVLQEGKSTL